MPSAPRKNPAGTRRQPSQPSQPSPVPKEAFEEHAGRWVALRAGEIIAHADDAEQLLARPEVDAETTPFYVPDKRELF